MICHVGDPNALAAILGGVVGASGPSDIAFCKDHCCGKTSEPCRPELRHNLDNGESVNRSAPISTVVPSVRSASVRASECRHGRRPLFSFGSSLAACSFRRRKTWHQTEVMAAVCVHKTDNALAQILSYLLDQNTQVSKVRLRTPTYTDSRKYCNT